MLLVLNIAALLLISLIPGGMRVSDPHGIDRLVNDSANRSLLLHGRLEEYDAALSEGLTRHLAADFARARRAASPESVLQLITGEHSDLAAIFRRIKTAITVATLASPLHTVGAAQALRLAVSWVESGLFRRSGLRAVDFPSFGLIVSHPEKARLGEEEERAVTSDLREATERANAGYSRLYGRLAEQAF